MPRIALCCAPVVFLPFRPRGKVLLLLNLSPLGAELLAATRQLLPLALRRDQLKATELVATLPQAGDVSVLIQLDPVAPWKRNSHWPALRLYDPQVVWTDELMDPIPLPSRELMELQGLLLNTGLVDDHEAVAVRSLTCPGLLLADVIDGLILNRRDPLHAEALAAICSPRAQRQLSTCTSHYCVSQATETLAAAASPVTGAVASASHPCSGVDGPQVAADLLTLAGMFVVALVTTARHSLLA